VIVLDASAVIELLLHTPTGVVVAAEVADPALSLHAPHLLAVEVTQVLRRYVAGGVLEPEAAVAALGDLTDLDIERYEHEPLLPRIWALRDNLTAYDACYVALAEVLDAPLLTTDAGLAAAPGHEARIRLLR